jgi:monoamine oxidase
VADVDLLVIGAGPAGIAAARTGKAAGARVLMLEARARIGGRAATEFIEGHPVDLGAHWLHMAEVNPLTALAQEVGIALKDPPSNYPVYERGKMLDARRRKAYSEAFAAAEERGARATAAADFDLNSCLDRGPLADTVAFNLALYCGRALEEISAFDCMRVEDARNKVPVGGLGALVAKLAEDIPVRCDCPVAEIREGPDGVVATGRNGEVFSAPMAVVALPIGVLRTGAVRFDPPLPSTVGAAIASLLPAFYEHAILHWPDHPFLGEAADRFTFFVGDRRRNICMLAAMDGTDLHSVEFGGPMWPELAEAPRSARETFLRSLLVRQFGEAALAKCRFAKITNWWNDPLALGSWSVAPPGRALARETLRDGLAGRMRLAGEFASPTQWGTVGGAWLAGVRAASALVG